MAGTKIKKGKNLEHGSVLDSADLNGDGVVSETELAMHEKMINIENADQREDAQRKMAWFALAGMLLYPFAVILAVVGGLDKGAEILGDMAATYFVSVAAIVAAFYGTQAYGKDKGK